MFPPCRLIAVLLVSVLACAAFAAAEQKDPQGKAILPYLDAGTFVVARLDVDRVDPETFATFMRTTGDSVAQAGKFDANMQARMKQDTEQAIQKGQAWLAGMNEAGGHTLYALMVNAGDLEQHEDDPVFVVPVTNESDIDRLGKLLREDLGLRRAESEQIGEVLVCGKRRQIDAIKAQAQASEPGIEAADLASALAGEGDAPLRIAILPGEQTRTWLEANFAEFPALIGGGSSAPLVRGMKWASINIAQKPKTLANVIIRCTDDAQAKSLFSTLTKSLAFVRQILSVAAPEKVTELDHVAPAIKENTITLSVDPSKVIMLRAAGAPRPANAPQPADSRQPDNNGL